MLNNQCLCLYLDVDVDIDVGLALFFVLLFVFVGLNPVKEPLNSLLVNSGSSFCTNAPRIYFRTSGKR